MSTVAVLGGGAGGFAAAVDLTLNGHHVRLWNRRQETIESLLNDHRLGYTGVLGSGDVVLPFVTTDLSSALDAADVAVVCQPALAHEWLFVELARLGADRPLVLNPGHTGGALHARAVFMAQNCPLPPVVEFSTLTYVARKPSPGTVAVTGKAGRVRAAALPGGELALRHAAELFPASSPSRDVLATSLANVNLVLHPPGAILGAAWVEAAGGQFTFYVQAMTDSVVRVIDRLDRERLAVARGFGHDLAPLLEEMSAIGTVDQVAAAAGDLGSAIRNGRANATIKAPDSLLHRYYREDFPYGLVPFTELARIAGISVPVAEALLRLGEIAAGEDYRAHGLNARRLAISGCSCDALQRIVRGTRPDD